MPRVALGVRAWLLLLSLLTSVPVVAFAGYVTHRLAEAEQRAILTNLVQRTDATAHAVLQRIEGWTTILSTLAQSKDALEGDPRGLYEHAVRLQKLHPDVSSITLVDRAGDQVFSTLRPFGTALPPSGAPDTTRQAIDDPLPHLSDVFTSSISREHVVAIGVPLYRGETVAYRLRIIVPVKTLNAVLDSQNLPDGWYAAVVNREGTVLSRNRAPEEVVGRKATPAFLDVIAQARRGTVDLPSADGTALKRAFIRMSPWEVTVMVGVPTDIYWASFRSSLTLVVAGGLALVVAGLLLATWFSGRLAGDVAVASAAARALGRGEAPSPGRTGVREIDELGRALVDAHRLLRRHDDAREAERRAAMEAKAEAERANLSKSKFLAAASHDLRQPVQSLMLFTGLLRTQAGAGRDGDALTHLERGLDALKDLLDSLLDMSRLDAGAVHPTVEDVPIATLLDQIATAYRAVAEGKGLRLEAETCDTVVRSDRTLLGRMIRNLVENAVRYTETGTISIDCRLDGDVLHIAVHDTGIGIPAEHLERIWEEFHRVANPGRDRGQGLGLGLAIVDRLSALLHHPVTVRSEPGKGSVFSVAVPLGDGVAEPAAVADAPAPRVQNRFALVIDDDTMVLLGLAAMLEGWGYTVLTAASAEQVAERLAEAGRRPDIILSDYRLPHATGAQTIQRIRDHCRHAIPGILLTGETGPEASREAARHGLHLIHKPVTPHQLADAMRACIGAAD